MALPEADAAINSNTNELDCRNLMRENIGNRDPAPIHFSWPFVICL